MKCVTQKLTGMMNRLVIGYETFFSSVLRSIWTIYIRHDSDTKEKERNVYHDLFMNFFRLIESIWIDRAKIGKLLYGVRIDIDILNKNIYK